MTNGGAGRLKPKRLPEKLGVAESYESSQVFPFSFQVQRCVAHTVEYFYNYFPGQTHAIGAVAAAYRVKPHPTTLLNLQKETVAFPDRVLSVFLRWQLSTFVFINKKNSIRLILS